MSARNTCACTLTAKRKTLSTDLILNRVTGKSIHVFNLHERKRLLQEMEDLG